MPCESSLDVSITDYARARRKESQRARALRVEEAAVAARPAVVSAPPEPTPTPTSSAAPPHLWLSCPPFDPVEIGTNPVVLGRKETCDPILPHVCVCFEHAIIRVEDGKVMVEDRSMNGTCLNGERIMLSSLRPRDVITLGPYDIHIADARPPKTNAPLTQPMRSFPSSTSKGGRFDRVRIEEVLRRLESHGATGTMKISGPGLAGVLSVSGGRPVHAELGDLRGEAAVAAMLHLEQGRFEFQSKRKIRQKTMNATFEALLSRGPG